MEIWTWILLIVVALIGGAVAGFFGSRALFKRELKKNPPINENMIRAMFTSMGQKPNEARIRAVMNNIKNQNK